MINKTSRCRFLVGTLLFVSALFWLPLSPSPPPISPDTTAECVRDSKHSPEMTRAEQETMSRYLRGSFPGSSWGKGEAVYLEWGSGGSTATYAAESRRAYTVEHVTEWCATVSNWTVTRCLGQQARWRLYCHDSETQTGEWGYPKDSRDHENFLERMRGYVQAPAKFGESTYDVVLIDGRLRVACAYAIISYLHAASVVAWHDFSEDAWKEFGTRETYGSRADESFPLSVTERRYSRVGAGRIFTKIERVGSLAFFRLHPTLLRHEQLMA